MHKNNTKSLNPVKKYQSGKNVMYFKYSRNLYERLKIFEFNCFIFLRKTIGST